MKRSDFCEIIHFRMFGRKMVPPPPAVVASASSPSIHVSLLTLLPIAAVFFVLWFRKKKAVEPVAGDLTKRGFATRKVDALGELDAIVIGSGIGGLSCAATLARSGKKVLVLEQHDVAGGCLHSFEDKGYEFDTGLHYVGIMPHKSGPMRLLNDLCEDSPDGPVEWAKMDEEYDVAVYGAQRLAMPAGKARLIAALQARFPEHSCVIQGYFDAVKEQQAVAGLFYIGKVLSSLIDSLMPSWLSWLGVALEECMGRAHTKLSDCTVAQMLDALAITHRPLRNYLTYLWGDYGLVPSRASWAVQSMTHNHYFDGGSYPVGGTLQIARKIIPTILHAGGDVLVRAPVESILVEGGRAVGVVMRRGQAEIRAKAVISAAGAANTFERLVPMSAWPQVAEARAALSDPAATEPSCAHLMLFVALDGSKSDLALPACNYWIAPGDEHCNVDELVDARAGMAPEAYLNAPLPAVFLSFPSAKDPSWDRRFPGGKSTAHIIAEAPWSLFEPWAGGRVKHRGAAYEELKARLTEKLLGAMYATHPHLKGRVVFSELGTPLSSAFYLGSGRGESYGLASTPRRWRQRWLKPATPLPGLYLAGQDVLSMGVIGALIGGFLTAIVVAPVRVVCKNLMTVVNL